MSEYKRGEMNIDEQKKIYTGFIKFLVAVAIFSIFCLIFLAIFNS